MSGVQDIVDAVQRLTPEQREELMECLFPPLGAHVGPSAATITRRARELAQGTAPVLTLAEVAARVDADLAARARR